MRRILISAAAMALLAVTAAGAVQLTTTQTRMVCLPPALIQAWS